MLLQSITDSVQNCLENDMKLNTGKFVVITLVKLTVLTLITN